MSRGNLLFDRADLTQKFGKLALYLSGTLPGATVDLAYEGRLKINNAIGDCWAELINGTLPPGHSVTVDNATREVVVRWPAYSEAAVPIINGDFELDDTSWLRGYGWTIENKGANPGATSGLKAAAFRGAGESWLEAATFYPLGGVQTAIKFVAQIQQGGSSAGNVRAAAALRYYDVNRKLLSADIGNVVSSGSNGEWKGSGALNGASTIPAGASYVRPAIWGLRKRQNEPLYADDFLWDLAGVAVGVHVPTNYPITIQVHDAGGRVASSKQTIVVLPAILTVSGLHFDGPNASTSFVDVTDKVWTPLGAAQITTANSKFGGASGLFDGASAISTTYDPDLDLLGGAFTIRGWVRQTLTGDRRIFALGGPAVAWNSTDGIHLLLQVDAGQRYALTAASGTTPIGFNSGSVVNVTNAWELVEVNCDGPTGDLRMYREGVLVGRVSAASIVRPSGNPVACYGRIAAQGTGNDWVGNLDDWQISKGPPVNTGLSYAVPTAPFAYP